MKRLNKRYSSTMADLEKKEEKERATYERLKKIYE